MHPLLDGHLLPNDLGSWTKGNPTVTAREARKVYDVMIKDCQEEDSLSMKNIRRFMLLDI